MGAYSKQEVNEFLDILTAELESSGTVCLHSLLALNDLMRQTDAREVFDESAIAKAKILWRKLTDKGLHVNEPPLLFGDALN